MAPTEEIERMLMPPPPKRPRLHANNTTLPSCSSSLPHQASNDNMEETPSSDVRVFQEDTDFSTETDCAVKHGGERISTQYSHVSVKKASEPQHSNFHCDPGVSTTDCDRSIDGSCTIKELDNCTSTSLSQECRQGIAGGTDQSAEERDKGGQEKKALAKPPNVFFSDIIGHSAAKLRIDEMLLPLSLPKSIADCVLTGIRAAPASILLHGPPGCGKTMLARAIAGEAQAAFLQIGPSDILSKFVGESEAAVRSLFKEANQLASSVQSRCAVIFFDEIDALGRSRGGREGVDTLNLDASDGSSRRVLAELLIQLTKLANDTGDDETEDVTQNEEDDSVKEGTLSEFIGDNVGGDPSQHRCFEQSNLHRSVVSPKQTSYDGKSKVIESTTVQHYAESCDNSCTRVIVVAATNRPEDCDSALLRRFAIRVLVGVPSARDRKRILRRLLTDVECSVTTQELNNLARATEGWTGSDLESVTREAAMAPVRECLRSAALFKRKLRQKKQCSGDKSAQEKIKDESIGADDQARNLLLHSFQTLRPVSVSDFQNAFNFWLGDEQIHSHSNCLNAQRRVPAHYDSSSDEETD